MGILGEVLDFLKEGRDVFKGDMSKVLHNRGPRSLTKEAEEGVLQFPMIASKAIPFSIIQDVQAASENKYANLIRIVYSMNATTKMSDTKGLKDYVRKFHQNGGKTDIDFSHVITLTEAMSMFESFDKDTCGNIVLESVVYEKASGKIVRENRKQLTSLTDGLNMENINDLFRPVTEGRRARRKIDNNPYLSDEDRARRIDRDFREEQSALQGRNYRDNYDAAKARQAGEEQKIEFQRRKDAREEAKEEREKTKQSQMDEKHQWGKNKEDRDQGQYASKMASDELSRATMQRQLNTLRLPSNTMLDSESKKGNELAPTMLQLVVNIQDDNGTIVGSQEFIIGVKVVIHPVATEEIISNLSTMSRGTMFDFLRWTSGEISFFKDFVLNVDAIKTDVANRSKTASGWIPALKRRAALSKIKNRFMVGQRLMPNATLVISIEEAEYIKANTGIDVMDSRYVDRLFADYFLLGYVVVDATNEIVHLRYDNTDEFETVSFRGLKKQSNSADFGEMLKMMNKF